MKNPIIYILSVVWVFASCEKVIDFKGEVKTPKIVINSLFNTEDSFKVMISNSLSLVDQAQLKALNEATVKLYDANHSLLGDGILTTDGNYYIPDVDIAQGNTYRIEVSNDGFTSVWAENEVPGKTAIVSVDINNINDQFNGPSKQISMKFKDDPGSENFYMVEVFTDYSFEYIPGNFDTYHSRQVLTTNDPSLSNNALSNGGYASDRLVFSNANFKGKEYTFVFSTYDYTPHDSEKVHVELHFSTLSKEAYSYFKSLDKYNQTDGNPFATPVQVFTNVENGFGIFAGAAKVKYILLD
ncbi:DUF4249 family protein [bacterium]|nr:DUF4249 family protein [bacterium]